MADPHSHLDLANSELTTNIHLYTLHTLANTHFCRRYSEYLRKSENKIQLPFKKNKTHRIRLNRKNSKKDIFFIYISLKIKNMTLQLCKCSIYFA